jgi:hypothetical protein
MNIGEKHLQLLGVLMWKIMIPSTVGFWGIYSNPIFGQAYERVLYMGDGSKFRHQCAHKFDCSSQKSM